jgi:hypothetical protein
MKTDITKLLGEQEPVEEPRQDRGFNPIFNAEGAFVDWIRQEFPDLNKHYNGRTHYKQFERREREVHQAVKLVWESIEISTYACVYEKYKSKWIPLQRAYWIPFRNFGNRYLGALIDFVRLLKSPPGVAHTRVRGQE